MKIAIVKNNYDRSKEAASKIKKILSKKHTITNVSPDIVIAVGGDGTFLTSIQKFWVDNPKATFFAVHSGTLGFYSDYTCSEIELFIKTLEEKEYEVELNNILEISIDKKTHYALNDFRIESTHKTAGFDVRVNGTFLERFRGNGLCFSTQSGSTAYNKSLGGAIMWPSVSGFQMTEVAPISNNTYSSLGSPLVFSNDDSINILGNFEDSFFTFDTKWKEIKGQKEIKISVAKKKVKIARFKKHYNFYKRLQDGFIK